MSTVVAEVDFGTGISDAFSSEPSSGSVKPNNRLEAAGALRPLRPGAERPSGAKARPDVALSEPAVRVQLTFPSLASPPARACRCVPTCLAQRPGRSDTNSPNPSTR